jgi:hypothetical protein
MSNPHYNIHGVYSSPSPSKKQVNRGTRTSSFDSPPTQPERNTGGNTGWRDEKDDSGIDMSEKKSRFSLQVIFNTTTKNERCSKSFKITAKVKYK